MAIRFRDYKNDDFAATKVLDVALAKAANESKTNMAEALVIRIELAGSMNELEVVAEYKSRLDAMDLSKEELRALTHKHDTAR